MLPVQNDLTVWAPSDNLKIASDSMDEIVTYGRPQLTDRDAKSIVAAFENRSYEMVATFVWTKAAAILKKRIAGLGMDFVGEMLGRPDLNEDSDPATTIADYEAISLAEDLGLINTTQSIRLRHSLELVTHFLKIQTEGSPDADEMEESEAKSLVKACVTSVLSHPNSDTALKFASFRASLVSRTIKEDDNDVLTLTTSPYFFIRTTMSVLLSLIKTIRGAQQEHAIGNFNVLLPLLWGRLRQAEKWQIGQAYAEVNAAGERVSSAGLKRALLRVHGFDFVPESLRSRTFSEAAAKVLAAHFSFNNFYMEKEPMSVLADLGTAIPKPAFAKSMEATLAVWIGNQYGYAFDAVIPAKKVLDGLRSEQWEYYLNECLAQDKTVLEKLMESSSCIARWETLVDEYRFMFLTMTNQDVARLTLDSSKGLTAPVKITAARLRNRLTQ